MFYIFDLLFIGFLFIHFEWKMWPIPRRKKNTFDTVLCETSVFCAELPAKSRLICISAVLTILTETDLHQGYAAFTYL